MPVVSVLLSDVETQRANKRKFPPQISSDASVSNISSDEVSDSLGGLEDARIKQAIVIEVSCLPERFARLTLNLRFSLVTWLQVQRTSLISVP